MYKSDEMEAVQSSNIESVGYDEADQEVYVKFLNGSVYVYRGVPIKLIDKIVVSYQTSKPTEIFIAHRVGEDGELKKSTQTIHFESAKDLSAIQFGGIDPNPTPIPTP